MKRYTLYFFIISIIILISFFVSTNEYFLDDKMIDFYVITSKNNIRLKNIEEQENKVDYVPV
jgi:hypothetical protein